MSRFIASIIVYLGFFMVVSGWWMYISKAPQIQDTERFATELVYITFFEGILLTILGNGGKK